MIPNDVSRCLGIDCPVRETCQRYLQLETDRDGLAPVWRIPRCDDRGLHIPVEGES